MDIYIYSTAAVLGFGTGYMIGLYYLVRKYKKCDHGEFLVASFACREKPRSVPRISEADLETDDYTPLEKLKNALLTFALVNINSKDMAFSVDSPSGAICGESRFCTAAGGFAKPSKLYYQYEKYNGDKFPALSGSSVAHACYTYIFHRSTFRKSVMYSKAYENKLDAIEKYLNLHLNTQEQTFDFFEKFCKKHTECGTR